MFLNYDNELNTRIMKRNIPDQNMKPNYSFRPEPTKYSDFKIIDKPKSGSVKLLKYSKVVFNPGDRGPTDQYFQNVDVETQLRSQYFALQKDSQAVYVPNSTSDLYINSMNYEKTYTSYKASDDYKIPLCKKLDPLMFNNSTRYYMKS